MNSFQARVLIRRAFKISEKMYHESWRSPRHKMNHQIGHLWLPLGMFFWHLPASTQLQFGENFIPSTVAKRIWMMCFKIEALQNFDGVPWWTDITIQNLLSPGLSPQIMTAIPRVRKSFRIPGWFVGQKPGPGAGQTLKEFIRLGPQIGKGNAVFFWMKWIWSLVSHFWNSLGTNKDGWKIHGPSLWPMRSPRHLDMLSLSDQQTSGLWMLICWKRVRSDPGTVWDGNWPNLFPSKENTLNGASYSNPFPPESMVQGFSDSPNLRVRWSSLRILLFFAEPKSKEHGEFNKIYHVVMTNSSPWKIP